MRTQKLKHFLHAEAVARGLTAGGVREEAAGRLAGQMVRVAARLRADGQAVEAPACAFFVPGRIEVLGKHTDYAGGSSLVCAIERGFCVIALPEAATRLHLTAAETGETVSLALREDLAPRPGHWSTYAATVARRAARNFPGALRGGRFAFASDLPQAAGMSSSSALVVAVFLALSALGDLTRHPAYRQHIDGKERLAHYLGCVENGQTFGTLVGDRGVGTFGGSEDHTAILCAVPGTLRRYAYAPTRFERAVPQPAGYVFVLAASGVTAEKAGAAQARYNRAARLAAAAAQAWRAATGRDDPHLGAALAGPAFARDRMLQALRAHTPAGFAAADVIDRFEHFYTENALILPAAVDALAAGDLPAFGALVDRSQRAAERLLKNQIEETIFLARQARALGAVAASAFGAGFGGSVWALVQAGGAEDFLEAWAGRYAAAFPEAARRSSFFVEQSGPAAFQLDVT